MASSTTLRTRSVMCSFMIAEITEGFSPASTAPAVITRPASIM